MLKNIIFDGLITNLYQLSHHLPTCHRIHARRGRGRELGGCTAMGPLGSCNWELKNPPYLQMAGPFLPPPTFVHLSRQPANRLTAVLLARGRKPWALWRLQCWPCWKRTSMTGAARCWWKPRRSWAAGQGRTRSIWWWTSRVACISWTRPCRTLENLGGMGTDEAGWDQAGKRRVSAEVIYQFDCPL